MIAALLPDVRIRELMDRLTLELWKKLEYIQHLGHVMNDSSIDQDTSALLQQLAAVGVGRCRPSRLGAWSN